MLHWLNENSGIKVKKQALLSFVMGPYEDEVWCDVLPMSACHILLGRPWQFDREVVHQGRDNIYIVSKGKNRFHLKPLSPNKEFVEALEQGEQAYVLMVRDVEEGIGVHDETVQMLLNEFGDVFPEELPLGLPPKRGIEHQIDLIPGATLPNKPAYRCNPEEAKELQRQAQELIDRGYVQESLSLCAVPALLVPKKDGTDAGAMSGSSALLVNTDPNPYFNDAGAMSGSSALLLNTDPNPYFGARRNTSYVTMISWTSSSS
ncbi:uncharacterized protein LOC141637407 [Silene latifolia]|uniref:uncharacterized protein LOC141637407 n=1 Tax=Silene latifolia TaxID=37657 RepID=UPI003D779842